MAAPSTTSGCTHSFSKAQISQHIDNAVQQLASIPPRTWACVAVAALAVVYKGVSKRYIPCNTVLEIDLRKETIREPESDTDDSFLGCFLPPSGIHLHTLVRTILKASKDKRITGLVLRLGGFMAPATAMEEIRDAVVTFRKAGKKTLCYSDTFLEAGTATLHYWFATAFEEIYMPSIGQLTFVNLKAQVPFARQLFTKIGAKPLLTTRRRYKTFANLFTEESLTEEHKEVTEHMLHTIYEQVVADIAEARKLSVETVRELIVAGPFSSSKALEAKLIDGIKYENEFYNEVLPAKFAVKYGVLGTLWNKLTTCNQEPKGVNLLYASNFYKKAGGSPYKSGKTKVALINVIGTIQMGESKTEWDGTESSAGADTVCLALRQATKDKKVKAILIRVASGGGSAVASDLIAHEVLEAKKAGKKIIVSMAQAAASGGYYVACHADKIVACPLTVTGSIGVVAGKFNLRDTFGKLGLTFDDVSTGKNADLWDTMEGYEGENKDKLEAFTDDIYEKFKAHVAAGRKMTAEQVEAVAQGRVWMGKTALINGLVDAIGGFETAISTLRQELALKDDAPLKLAKFPVEPSFLEMLKPVKNSRVLPKSASAAWFLPASVSRSISIAALAWKTWTSVSESVPVVAAFNALSQLPLSQDGLNLVLEPSLFSVEAQFPAF